VNFYRSTQGGTTPKRVFLCGGSTPLRYIAEFFVEKLQARVEFFNPLKNVVVADGVLPEDMPPGVDGLGELVGCALRGLGDCPMELALTPPAVIEARKMARRIPNLAIAAAFLIATPLLWWFQSNRMADSYVLEKDRLAIDSQALQADSQKIDAFFKKEKKLQAELAPFLISAAERSVWAKILNELSAKIPNRFIWVTSLTPVETEATPTVTPPGNPPPGQPNPAPAAKQAPTKSITHLEVKGLFLDPDNDERGKARLNEKGAAIVDEFYTGLFGSKVFEINESTDRASVITERTTPTGETWAYSFTMRLPLKTPIPLP
jgi:type IV pilus assembly protein PilM